MSGALSLVLIPLAGVLLWLHFRHPYQDQENKDKNNYSHFFKQVSEQKKEDQEKKDQPS